MQPCLEHTEGRVIRKHARPNRTVHRQFNRACKPIGLFDHEEDMTSLADAILKRMRKNRHLSGTGSYVMGDQAGQVYVVSEGSATGMTFVDSHSAWLIGRYCSGLRGVLPMVEQVIGDLHEHFKVPSDGVAA